MCCHRNEDVDGMKYVNMEGAGDGGEKRGPELTSTTTSNLLFLPHRMILLVLWHVPRLRSVLNCWFASN